jgi:hypothetical protein
MQRRMHVVPHALAVAATRNHEVERFAQAEAVELVDGGGSRPPQSRVRPQAGKHGPKTKKSVR